jgi:alkylation response protein AidB-like acyl-CoA dehydrogenase
VSAGAPLAKMGLHGSWTAELVLDGVHVPAANRLGDEGVGFTVAMSALDSGRVGISAQAVGIAQGALDVAVESSRRRRDAGLEVDGPALADMEVRTAAARQLTRYAAALVDAGQRVTFDAAIAKLFSTDTCVAVAQSAVDLCAPESGADDHPAAVRFRDAKACQIYEGTNQIQRVVIARHLLRTDLSWLGSITRMDVRLNEEQTMIRDTVRDIARDRIAPRAAEIDRTGEFPWDVVDLFRKHDLFALPFPPEYGGLSGSALTLNVAIEEVAKVCATSALILAVQALGGYPLIIAGTDDQKARLLPDMASGAKLGAYALSEPGAGSDPAGMETRAERHGDEYVITGSKLWITAGGVADTITVFAKTDPNERAKGVSAFVLEDAQHLKGFAANTIHGKLGIRGSNTAELQFDEVVIPAANRLGEEGDGFRIAMKVLDRSRPGVAAQALGIAQGALDYAVGYAKERKQFGKAIAEFQGIQFMVADMEAQTAAARAMVYWASQLIDDKSPDVSHFAAIAKLLAADTAMKVTTDAVQILVGYGYVNEYPVERMMRDAKITQIYEGTSQIQRVVIARDLLRA